MPARLEPLSAERFPAWRAQCVADYTADLVATGLDAAEAGRQAEASLDGAFATGGSTEENAVFDIVDETDAVAGYVWLGTDTSPDPTSWWVWDIAVDPAFRGRGLARRGMQLAEEYARANGATTLGLSVFGFNDTARGLYESLGYETPSIKMRKALGDG
ncbi:MAG: GNAT family N-acetyltransferase [Microbacterium arborescens]